MFQQRGSGRDYEGKKAQYEAFRVRGMTAHIRHDFAAADVQRCTAIRLEGCG